MIRIFKVLHKIYKTIFSPLLGNCCRFHPSCSDYSIEAVEKHGLLRGAILSIKRILRCSPFSANTWFDPVPCSKKNFDNKSLKGVNK